MPDPELWFVPWPGYSIPEDRWKTINSERIDRALAKKPLRTKQIARLVLQAFTRGRRIVVIAETPAFLGEVGRMVSQGRREGPRPLYLIPSHPENDRKAVLFGQPWRVCWTTPSLIDYFTPDLGVSAVFVVSPMRYLPQVSHLLCDHIGEEGDRPGLCMVVKDVQSKTSSGFAALWEKRWKGVVR